MIIFVGIMVLTLLFKPVQTWHWTDLFIYAPASAIAQELYFRSALLTTLEKLCKGRYVVALGLQAAAFAAWHARAFLVVPLAPTIALLFGTFLVGCFWGWQVRRDRTITWTMVQHALFLVAY